jgi:hypothetical protein
MLEVVRVVELEPPPLRFRIEVLKELNGRGRFYARVYRWDRDVLVLDPRWDWDANPADSAESALQAVLSRLKHPLAPVHTEPAQPPTVAPASSVQQAVRDLIDLVAPYADLAARFHATVDVLPPLTDVGPAVVLTHEDLMRALRLYLMRGISAENLSSWAGLLEMNQFVEYGEEKRGAIADVLFLLASPEINDPITLEYCVRLVRKLSSE